MSTFHLQIVTPDGQFFDGEAEKLRVRTITGDVMILKNHIKFVTALGMGRATIHADGKTRNAACIGGILMVGDQEVRLLATTFEWAEDIDITRANTAARHAQEILARKSDHTVTEVALAEARLKRALVRKRVAEF